MSALNTFVLLFSITTTPEIIQFEDNWGQHPLFNLVSESPAGVEIVFSMHEMVSEDQMIDGVPMKTYGVPAVFITEPGTPNLSGASRFIAVPHGAQVRVTVLDTRTQTMHNIDVAPSPNIPSELDTDPLHYVKNPTIYGRNAFYPLSPVQVSKPRKIRGVDVVIIGVLPFQYNPVTRELLIHKDIRFRVDFVGGTGRFGEDRLRNRFWEPMLKGHLLNYASLPRIEFATRPQNRDNVEYIIIIPDDADFAQWADTIKYWRILQGISCDVFTLTEVGGSSSTAIENFLNNAYATWDPAPVAFLLLSDYPASGDAYGITSPVWNSYCVSDNIYADVDGDDLPDMHHARITAQDYSDLETMINKFLDYERNPYTSAAFYDNPLCACGWQDDRWFQLASEVVRGFLINELGKSPSRQYNLGSPASPTPGGAWSTRGGTTPVVAYWNALGYIPLTNPYNSTWWNNGSASGVNAAINSGAFIVQHRDHGSTSGWGEPDYTTSDLNGLSNTEYTFVNSTNCLTGKYNISTEVFAERFHRIDYGCWGINAATEVSFSFVNDTYIWGMWDCLYSYFDPGYPGTDMTGYDDLRPCMAMTYGKYYLDAMWFPDSVAGVGPYRVYTYHLFHHHGDCFTTLYSEIPESLTVVHDATVPAGQTTFAVQADDSSVIALTEDYVILGVAEGTGSSIDIPIPAQDPNDTIVVTVTKANHYRYEERVPVTDAGMPETPTITRPLDFARLSDDQPTLSFNATDPQGDDIQYRILLDTDPGFASPESVTTGQYASGATVNFVYPSALTDEETYWWKIKCRDPGGSNFWTPYTTKRSFTIGLDLPVSSCSWYQTTAAQFNFNTLDETVIQGDSVILGASGTMVTDTLLHENFESGLPIGWTVINGNGDAYQWETGTTADLSTYTPPIFGTSYAYYSDDDAGGSVINYNEELLSPAIPVPSSAVEIEIEYGYGFRIYQTGEKYRVKVRTATGSTWNDWDDIALYTTSTFGTQTIDLTSYLPCDSVQFNWFYSDSTSSSHWGYACACDNVLLTYSYALVSDEGSMTGVAVDFDELDATYPRAHWGDIVWHKTSGLDSILLRVEYFDGSWQLIPNTELPGNTTGFYSAVSYDTIDLSALNTGTYNIIRLNAEFYRIDTDAPDDPALCDWEIGNLSNFLVGIESNQEMFIKTPMFRVFPSVSTHNIHIVFAAGAFDAETQISIYDAAGRVVRTFYPDPATSHLENQILWDRQDDNDRSVAAGVYFVQYKTKDFVRVNKAILLR